MFLLCHVKIIKRDVKIFYWFFSGDQTMSIIAKTES